ncbi:hypothetical protein BGZ57DRAFT_618713 [Hyaloscypha finlandica]|nr:hypothetical protein BGZ57DRAFT_618713 [Hyaloscypha finlandica]
MSFGFSIDFVSLLKLAKRTCDGCRSAPTHFGEAGKGAESIQAILSQIRSEVENPESVIHRDENSEMRLCALTRNCEEVLTQLDSLVGKFRSLGTAKKKTWDRLRYPRKDIGHPREVAAPRDPPLCISSDAWDQLPWEG